MHCQGGAKRLFASTLTVHVPTADELVTALTETARFTCAFAYVHQARLSGMHRQWLRHNAAAVAIACKSCASSFPAPTACCAALQVHAAPAASIYTRTQRSLDPTRYSMCTVAARKKETSGATTDRRLTKGAQIMQYTRVVAQYNTV